MSTNHNDPRPTGEAMRRKVRRATVGVVGAAVVASAVVTASIAYADGTDDQGNATTASKPAVSDTDDETAETQPAQPSTSALAAPTQAPSASGGGRGHASSGGS